MVVVEKIRAADVEKIRAVVIEKFCAAGVEKIRAAGGEKFRAIVVEKFRAAGVEKFRAIVVAKISYNRRCKKFRAKNFYPFPFPFSLACYNQRRNYSTRKASTSSSTCRKIFGERATSP